MERQGQLKEANGADSNANAQVELFDNGVSLGLAPVIGSGWQTALSGLQEGRHVLTAKSTDGTIVSNSWAFQVERKLAGVENFDSLPDTILSVGQSIETPMMTINFLEGEGSVGIKPPDYYYPGKIERQALQLHLGDHGGDPKPPGQTVSMRLNGSCTSVSFWCSSLNERDHEISFYNLEGSLLGMVDLPANMGLLERTFTALGIREIVFKTARPDWFLVDTFTFT